MNNPPETTFRIMSDHEFETVIQKTRLVRDVIVIRCKKCGLLSQISMREKKTFREKIAQLKLDPCLGKP